MLVEFINPEGRKNSADLSVEQVEELKKTEGYVVLTTPPNNVLDFDLPVVEAKKSTKVRLHVSESACVDCE